MYRIISGWRCRSFQPNLRVAPVTNNCCSASHRASFYLDIISYSLLQLVVALFMTRYRTRREYPVVVLLLSYLFLFLAEDFAVTQSGREGLSLLTIHLEAAQRHGIRANGRLWRSITVAWHIPDILGFIRPQRTPNPWKNASSASRVEKHLHSIW